MNKGNCMNFKSIFIFLSLSFFSITAMATICHPAIERAPSLKSELKWTGKALTRLEDKLEKVDEELGEWIGVLGETLKEDLNKEKLFEDITEHIANEMTQKDWKAKCTASTANPTPPTIGLCAFDNNERNKYIHNKGKVKDGFCKSTYVKNKTIEYSIGDKDKKKSGTKACKKAITKINKSMRVLSMLIQKQERLEDKQGELEDESWDREIDGLLGDSYTEAGSTVCVDCNRRRGQQTSGESSTAALKLFGGLLIAGYGMKEARRAQRSANETLALQGWKAENNFGYSLAGASLGMPFINSALYGSSRGGTTSGAYSCSTGVQYNDPYFGTNSGHPYAYGPGVNFSDQFRLLNANAHYRQNVSPYGPGIDLSGQFRHPGANLLGLLNANPYGPGANPYGPGINLSGQFRHPGANLLGLLNANPYGPNAYARGPGIDLSGQFRLLNANPYGPGANPYGPGANPYGPGGHAATAALQARLAAQQAAQAEAKIQLEIRMKAQEAYLAQQESIQKEWIQKQQVIGDLTQEMYRIQSQIQSISYGGSIGSSSLRSSHLSSGAGSGSLTVKIGSGVPSVNGSLNKQGPTDNPAPSNNNGNGGVTIIQGR